jgi:hypothetical protein
VRFSGKHACFMGKIGLFLWLGTCFHLKSGNVLEYKNIPTFLGFRSVVYEFFNLFLSYHEKIAA